MTLNYNEVVNFMKEFGVDLLNRSDELIIDELTNTYTWIGNCEDIDDVKTKVVYSLARPIGKGLILVHATRLLNKLNKYFNTELTRDDMLTIYTKLCYERKLPEFKEFVMNGLSMTELKEVSNA